MLIVIVLLENYDSELNIIYIAFKERCFVGANYDCKQPKENMT